MGRSETSDLREMCVRVGERFLRLAERAECGSKRRPPDPVKAAKYRRKAHRYLRWGLR